MSGGIAGGGLHVLFGTQVGIGGGLRGSRGRQGRGYGQPFRRMAGMRVIEVVVVFEGIRIGAELVTDGPAGAGYPLPHAGSMREETDGIRFVEGAVLVAVHHLDGNLAQGPRQYRTGHVTGQGVVAAGIDFEILDLDPAAEIRTRADQIGVGQAVNPILVQVLHIPIPNPDLEEAGTQADLIGPDFIGPDLSGCGLPQRRRARDGIEIGASHGILDEGKVLRFQTIGGGSTQHAAKTDFDPQFFYQGQGPAGFGPESQGDFEPADGRAAKVAQAQIARGQGGGQAVEFRIDMVFRLGRRERMRIRREAFRNDPRFRFNNADADLGRKGAAQHIETIDGKIRRACQPGPEATLAGHLLTRCATHGLDGKPGYGDL